MRAGVHKPLELAQHSRLHDASMALQLVCAVLISPKARKISFARTYRPVVAMIIEPS